MNRFSSTTLIVVVSFAAMLALGCGATPGTIPAEVRERGLLDALQKSCGPEEDLRARVGSLKIVHPSETEALLERMNEFAGQLSDPADRGKYVESLKLGREPRTGLFLSLAASRAELRTDAAKLGAAFLAVDGALAGGAEPELGEDRLLAMTASLMRGDAAGADRLAEAFTDQWDPQSKTWHLTLRAIPDLNDPALEPAWTAAAGIDLENEVGAALLAALQASPEKPLHDPFSTERGVETLVRRIQSSDAVADAQLVAARFASLDRKNGERLWEAAKALPPGLQRLIFAEGMYLATERADALELIAEATADERTAVAATKTLAMIGRSERARGLDGDALGRARGFYIVATEILAVPSDAALRNTILEMVASSPATACGDDFAFSALRFHVPAPELEDGAFSGILFVNDRAAYWTTAFDRRSSLSAKAWPDPRAWADSHRSRGETIDARWLGNDDVLVDEIARYGPETVLDLLVVETFALGPYRERIGIVGRTLGETSADLIAGDDRWQVFDVPLASLEIAREEVLDESAAP